jgi:hypothetical protein
MTCVISSSSPRTFSFCTFRSVGHREVVGGWHFALAGCAGQAELRAVCDERHCQARGVDDVAGAVVAENGVKLIFTSGRKAAVAALFVAVEFLIAESTSSSAGRC